MPIGQIVRSEAPKPSSNESPQDFFRGSVFIKCVVNGYELGSSHRLLQYLGIQSQLIAEVIVDSSDIRSCFRTNLANGRSLITAVGKNRPCNLQQFLACWVEGRSPAFAPHYLQPGS